MKYFLTGATGFVGGRLARQLVEGGHQVNALVRSPAKAGDLKALGASLFAGDVTDLESLRAPMAGVDGVYHVAGWYKLGVRTARERQEAEAINVQGTRNVLTVMRDLGVPKGVYTSSLVVNSDTHGQLVDESYRFEGRHLSVYDRTKAEAHAVAEEFMRAGLPLVIVMPGVIYGPGDTSLLLPSIRQYLKRQLPLLPTGTAFCWAHVDDTAHGHRLAMEKGRVGESYIIAGPPHRVTEFFEQVHSLTGVPPPIRVPGRMLAATAVLMSVVEKLIPLPVTYTREYLRENGGVTYWGDNAKAKRELGYSPRALADGLPDVLKEVIGN